MTPSGGLPDELRSLLNLLLADGSTIWEALSDNARYSVWSADQFVMGDGPNAFQIRMISKTFAEEIRDDRSERITVIRRGKAPLALVR